MTSTPAEPDPIAVLAEVAAAALGDYRPVEDLRPVVEAVLAEAAAQQWIDKQLAETGLKAMDFRNGMTMELEPAREMVAAWCGAARAMLGDAPNYSETPIEMEVKVGESPERFAFVLQRVGFGKLTPHEARQQAEVERDRFAAEAEQLRQQLDAFGGPLAAGGPR